MDGEQISVAHLNDHPTSDIPVKQVGTAQEPKPANLSPKFILELQDLFKIYREGEIETVALRGVTLSIEAGEFVTIRGRSGSGKSTLLGLAAGLSLPSAGKVLIEGRDIARLSETERAALRGRRLGLVFQSNNLIPFLSVLENVELVIEQSRPGKGSTPEGQSQSQRQSGQSGRLRAKALLERVGLAERLGHRPAQLSGGEQQRVAIALALVNQPAVLLADEPTGELDTASANGIMQLLEELNREDGITIVLVTHNQALAPRSSRQLRMADGLLTAFQAESESQTKNGTVYPGSERTKLGLAANSINQENNPLILEATGLVKKYPNGVVAVNEINLSVNAGESVALMGPSGCGKSTLLNMLGGLDIPTSGEVRLGDRQFSKLDKGELALVRRREIGFVFQSHNLIATLTARENVALPLVLDGVPPAEWEVRADELLNLVGLAEIGSKTPDQLSGGQRQRVAIARSLAHRPNLLLADEPTGSLDSDTAESVIILLTGLTRDRKLALVLVTHDPVITGFCNRQIHMQDGHLVSDLRAQHLRSAIDE